MASLVLIRTLRFVEEVVTLVVVGEDRTSY